MNEITAQCPFVENHRHIFWSPTNVLPSLLQLKIEAKLSALEDFQDMDDSLSSISTVSDDSATDSGFDHHNWVSNLASLTEIEETNSQEGKCN